MKKFLAIVLCAVVLCTIVSCGGGDALKGTWTCSDKDYGEVIWKFNGSGKCSLENDYFENEGVYSIDADKVTIKLDLWDSETVYLFAVDGNNLKLTATDGLAPDYDLTKK